MTVGGVRRALRSGGAPGSAGGRLPGGGRAGEDLAVELPDTVPPGPDFHGNTGANVTLLSVEGPERTYTGAASRQWRRSV